MPSHHDQAVELLVRAFWEYPESLHLLPDPGVRTRALARFLASVLRDAEPFGEVEVAESRGALTGIAIWLPPAANPPSRRRQAAHVARLMPLLAVAPTAVPEALRSQIAARRQDFPGPHRLLAFLGVDPPSRSEGIGSALVGSGLRRGDSRRDHVVLSTSDRSNVKWYEGFGFTVCDELRLSPTWPTVWRMQRGYSPEQ